MITVRLEHAPAFVVAGRRTWIDGPDSGQFGRFWQQCCTDGTLAHLARLRDEQRGTVTGGAYIGVSRVEADPTERRFWFHIGVETTAAADHDDLTVFTVPSCRWAVFATAGALPDALVDAERYAFDQWLPASGHVHASAPEMEVYPPRDGGTTGTPVEFWLPIVAAERHHGAQTLA